jgi:hypothetical protein
MISDMIPQSDPGTCDHPRTTFARRFIRDQRRCCRRTANKDDRSKRECSGPHRCDGSITAAFPHKVFGNADRSEAGQTSDQAGAALE